MIEGEDCCLNAKKIFLLLICVVFTYLLTSCYSDTVKSADDYDEFREEMKEEYEPIYKLLPEVTDKSCIQDMYLHMFEDILDTNYAIYLNCVYSDEDYEREEERLTKLFGDMEFLQTNPKSFEYESLMTGFLTEHHLQYEYALFDRENLRIVYVWLYEDQTHHRYTKIPEEYLPKELLESSWW